MWLFNPVLYSSLMPSVMLPYHCRVSAILTVFDLTNGGVLQQNERSVEYLGNLMSISDARFVAAAAAHHGGSSFHDGLRDVSRQGAPNMLRELFQLDQERLFEMLGSLAVRGAR